LHVTQVLHGDSAVRSLEDALLLLVCCVLQNKTKSAPVLSEVACTQRGIGITVLVSMLLVRHQS
jgi:hypothetical protein